ncbi:MAG: SH3 domain-containing protein [Cyanobacterium sp.]
MIKTISILLVLATGVMVAKPDRAIAQYEFTNERSTCYANLTASSNATKINLRSGPGTQYNTRGYGLVGDFVYILEGDRQFGDYAQDSTGKLWYKVGFPKSGARGWIRADFLRLSCAP